MIITLLEHEACEVSERMTEWSDLNLLCEWRGEFLPGFYSEAIIVTQLRLISPIKLCHSQEPGVNIVCVMAGGDLLNYVHRQPDSSVQNIKLL